MQADVFWYHGNKLTSRTFMMVLIDGFDILNMDSINTENTLAFFGLLFLKTPSLVTSPE